MKFLGWTLGVAWFAYIAFLGPFLISARDWFLVGLGAILFVALVVGTWKFVQAVIPKEKNREVS